MSTNIFNYIGKEVNTDNLQGALSAAGLDWQVEKRSLYDIRQTDGQTVAMRVPKAYGTFRTDTNTALGVVGENYKVVQNFEKFFPLNSLINEGATFTNAGSLKGGALVYAQMSLPEGMDFDIRGDQHKTKLTIQSSHDGSVVICIGLSMITIICQNTFNMALVNAILRIKHTTNAKQRLFEAHDIIAETQKEKNALKAVLETLASKKMTEKGIAHFLLSLENGKSSRADNIRATIAGLAIAKGHNNIEDLEGTAYAWFNGTTDYVDHAKSSAARGWSKEERAEFERTGRDLAAMLRAESALIGTGNQLKVKAFETLKGMAKDLPDMPAVSYSIPSAINADGKAVQVIELEKPSGVPATWLNDDGTIGFDPKALGLN